MLSKVCSAEVNGIDAYPVEVEVNVGYGDTLIVVVGLPDAAVKALRAHHVRQLQERLAAGSRWHEQGLIFPTTVGTPIDPSELHEDFKRILAKVGLPVLHASIHSA